MMIVMILAVVENQWFDIPKTVESDLDISSAVIHREYEERNEYLKYNHRNDMNLGKYECR